MIEPLHSYNVHDRLIALSSIELLYNVDRETKVLIAEHTRYRLVGKDELLFSSFDPEGQVAFILQGSVSIKVNQKELETVGAGSTVGLEPLFIHEEIDIEVRAIEPCLALQISPNVIYECFEQNAILLHSLRSILARKVLKGQHGLPNPDKYTLRDENEFGEQMTDVEKILELRRDGILAYANINAVIDMARRATEQRYTDGAVLWRQGDIADGMIRCVNGEIICENESGQVVIGPGYTIGALDTNAEMQRAYSARAKGDIIILRFRKEDIFLTLETHIKLAFDLMRLIMLQRFSPLLT